MIKWGTVHTMLNNSYYFNVYCWINSCKFRGTRDLVHPGLSIKGSVDVDIDTWYQVPGGTWPGTLVYIDI